MNLARTRFLLATELLAIARRGMGAEHGVTVLVHGAGGEASPVVAMQTTLPSRKAVRAQLVQVLYQSLMADGATVDNVGELAVRELDELLEGAGG